MGHGETIDSIKIMGAWLWVKDNDKVYGGFLENDDKGLHIRDKGEKIYLKGKGVFLNFKMGEHYC